MRAPSLASLLAVSAAVSTLFLSGCSGLLGEPTASSEPASEDLRRRVAELEREKTVAQVEEERLRREIARLEAENETLRESLAEARQSREDEERRRLATAPPAAAPPAALPSAGIESQDLEDEELAPPPPPAPAPSASRPSGPSSPGPSFTSPSGDDGQELYDESYTLLNEQHYEAAEQSFRRYLTLYPASDLSDNAQFWIGESYFARQEYEAALEAYLATVERYPEGNKVPDALFKAGRAYEEMGDLERAVAAWEEVDQRFHGTAAAAAAAERLAARR